VKPVEHGRERDRYSYGVVVRDSAPWETVKPINVAVKMKTELFSSALILPARYTYFNIFLGGRGIFYFFSYYIQHCFICRPSNFIVLTDARIEPRTVATCASAVRRSNH
jgi:hypothetical protein